MTKKNHPSSRNRTNKKRKRRIRRKSDQEKKQEQQKSPGDKKDDAKPEDKNGEGQPVAPGQMTPEEAKRLLDAQKGDEQVLKFATERPAARPPKAGQRLVITGSSRLAGVIFSGGNKQPRPANQKT